MWQTENVSINFIDVNVKVSLPENEMIDEVQNICPDDFRKFIKDTTNIEVSIFKEARQGAIRKIN